ncbi:MAG: helix-turn-helix domain-containing protein [Rhodospirillaceae bacterium]|nr:helix-turn-helix domain-containing protein [Rhodospirillaceae bacterium]MDE0619120.1 helix-turn-helix domain-containing protein [Rhodospirillaceae bacterium]
MVRIAKNPPPAKSRESGGNIRSRAGLRGYDLVAAAVRLVERGALSDRDAGCVRSIARHWSERGTTAGQDRMLSAIVAKAKPASRGAPAGGYVPAPSPYRRPWWLDTSSLAQHRRGVKSGCVRRHRTYERDARIARWINRGHYTVRQVARHTGLNPSTISRIASRARGGRGFWTALRRSLPRVLRQPSWNTQTASGPPPSARLPEAVGPRNTTGLFDSLMAWTGLRAVRQLPDAAVFREAERLNGLLCEPLKVGRVRSVARSVCRYVARSVCRYRSRFGDGG